MFNWKKKFNYRRQITEIKKFNLDWSSFFEVNNINSNMPPIEFFVKKVHHLPLIVPDVLDVGYYLKTYPDINSVFINPLIHYIRNGKKESRRPFPSKKEVIPQISAEQIKHDFYILQQQGLNWSSYVESYSLSNEDEAIAHYCSYWPTILPAIEGVIDTEYYVEHYSDIWELGHNPLVHFITHGKQEGRSAFKVERINPSKPKQEVIKAPDNSPVCEFELKLRELKVQWNKFNSLNNINVENIEPIQYILDKHNHMMLNIPGIFDSKLYLELYPDIAKAGVSPLYHYIAHGRSEGRIGYFNVEKHFHLGASQFDANKTLYIIVCHESSATGAPLVGFNLAQQLSKKYNVVNFVLKEDKLQAAFVEESIATLSDIHVQSSVLAKKALKYIVSQFKDIDGIICNSVETAYVLQAANELNIPSVSLVHEFSEYTRPVGKITSTVFHADRVIVPAQALKDSMCRELKSFRAINVVPNNIVIQPQGRLPYIPEGHGKLDCRSTLLSKIGLSDTNDTHVLVGAGYIQIRKGVDLFVSAAKRIKDLTNKPCKFIWVGEGYNPDTDLNYANWLQTQITLNGLEDDVVFLGHQRNLDNVMSLTDVFCMTSRLDPFPNVVIDALDADVHVACFDKSTGCADFLKNNKANATVADYLDIEQFSQSVSKYLNAQERYKGINQTIVKQSLNFDNYTNEVLKELNNASNLRKKIAQSIKVIDAKNCFNANFYDPNISAEQALKEYVQLGMKGIHLNNPTPGFNEQLWFSQQEGGNPYLVGLAEALTKSESPRTHKTYEIIPNKQEENINFSYAIHLHLYYPDLAVEFARYFAHLPHGYDLYVTHLNGEDTDSITQAFKNSGAKKIQPLVIENNGRNIGAFVDIFKQHITRETYDVIGHFHSKKSLAVGGDMGDRWRDFLLETLIGDTAQASQVLALFNDEKIGLVFPEDRHCVDSADNKRFIGDLYTEMAIKADEQCYLYPVGAMFWANVNALEPLRTLDEKFYTHHEPVPYDGTYLHALERVFLPVADKQGYEAITTFNSGINW